METKHSFIILILISYVNCFEGNELGSYFIRQNSLPLSLLVWLQECKELATWEVTIFHDTGHISSAQDKMKERRYVNFVWHAMYNYYLDPCHI